MKNKETNPFYAILYIYWEFFKKFFLSILSISKFHAKFWDKVLSREYHSESNVDKNTRDALIRKGGIACYYSVCFMTAILAFKNSLFILPISKLISNQVSDKSLTIYIILGLSFISVIPPLVMMDEKYYNRHFSMYEKRDKNWKLKWKIISFIDFLFSITCVYFGDLIAQSIQ